MPVPPPATFPDRFLKLRMYRPKPLQGKILEYLNDGRKASIHAISEDLGVNRFSARRCLNTMESEGLVTNQVEFFAESVVPGIKAHMFHITDTGRRELRFLQSTSNLAEPIPLGWRILLYMSHGVPVTIGPIAKMTGKPNGHVRRVMKSLQNRGLVDCLYSKTHTSFGQDVITHLYRIAEAGQQTLENGPGVYLKKIRSHAYARS